MTARKKTARKKAAAKDVSEETAPVEDVAETVAPSTRRLGKKEARRLAGGNKAEARRLIAAG